MITATDDSVVLAFADDTWGSPWPPTEFLSTGEKSRVDTRLGERISVTKEDGGDARLVLGEGLWVPDYRGNALAPGHGANFYQDEKGIRLIALEGEHFGSDMIILSQESRHPARLVHIDFSSLRTESGIGLRDRRDRVLKALGEASHLDAFGQYQLLWYLGEVEADKYGGRFACAAAYVLKEDRVVEIWLYVWSPDPSG